MKFVKAKSGASNLSSLQGYLEVPYSKLVEVFGQPHHDGDGYKVDAEWVVKFEDGTLIAESEVAVFLLKDNRLDILTEDYQTSFDLNETFAMEI